VCYSLTWQVMTWSIVSSTLIVFVMSTSIGMFIMSSREERAIEISSLALTYSIIVPYFLAIVNEVQACH
jgi:hypothetical protein